MLGTVKNNKYHAMEAYFSFLIVRHLPYPHPPPTLHKRKPWTNPETLQILSYRNPSHIGVESMNKIRGWVEGVERVHPTR